MRNKRKGILMASAILGSAAIVSTGFAAWVITVEDTKEATGNIQVDTVTDNSHFLTVTAVDANVYFGLPQTKGTVVEGITPWLTEADGTVEHENLTAEFTVEVTNFASAVVTPTLKTKPANFDQTRDSKRLLADPEIELGKFTAKSSGDTTGVATLTVTFKWGEYFGTKNPYQFYNAHKATDLIKGNDTPENKDDDVMYAKDAVEVLTELAKLNNQPFVIELVTSKASS